MIHTSNNEEVYELKTRFFVCDDVYLRCSGQGHPLGIKDTPPRERIIPPPTWVICHTCHSGINSHTNWYELCCKLYNKYYECIIHKFHVGHL